MTWIRQAAGGFSPESNEVMLADGSALRYRVLVAAPGLKLDWDAIPGLTAALGNNGVTSNYRYDLAPYTLSWCAACGADALCSPSRRCRSNAPARRRRRCISPATPGAAGALKHVEVEFHNAGAVLFGVPAYVPALMKYVERYGIDLRSARRSSRSMARPKPRPSSARAPTAQPNGCSANSTCCMPCRRRCAPDFVAKSPLAGETGFIAVDPGTLRHPRYPNVFSLGDACSTTNAKTAAAARKQAPVVAVNVLATLDGGAPAASMTATAPAR